MCRWDIIPKLYEHARVTSSSPQVFPTLCLESGVIILRDFIGDAKIMVNVSLMIPFREGTVVARFRLVILTPSVSEIFYCFTKFPYLVTISFYPSIAITCNLHRFLFLGDIQKVIGLRKENQLGLGSVTL